MDLPPPAPRSALASTVFRALQRSAHGLLRPADRRAGLESCDLVHEAYLRLARDRELSSVPRTLGLARAVVCLQNTLVDLVRRRRAQKRGGHTRREELSSGLADGRGLECDDGHLTRILEQLGRLHPRAVRVVQLHVLEERTFPEIAELLGSTVDAVRHDWRLARAWLKVKLTSMD
jgi:RNA polymerase sigma factor (TIGR02999 family)